MTEVRFVLSDKEYNDCLRAKKSRNYSWKDLILFGAIKVNKEEEILSGICSGV